MKDWVAGGYDEEIDSYIYRLEECKEILDKAHKNDIINTIIFAFRKAQHRKDCALFRKAEESYFFVSDFCTWYFSDFFGLEGEGENIIPKTFEDFDE